MPDFYEPETTQTLIRNGHQYLCKTDYLLVALTIADKRRRDHIRETNVRRFT